MRGCAVQPLYVACGDLRHVLQPTDALLRGVFALLEDRPPASPADADADALLDARGGGGGARQRQGLVRVELLVQFLQGGARALPWPDRTRWVADPRLRYFDAAADCYGVVLTHARQPALCRSAAVRASAKPRRHWAGGAHYTLRLTRAKAMQRASLRASLQ